MNSRELKVAILGLGYVGLPLAVAFGKIRKVVGFDLSNPRVNELINSFDRTQEMTTEELSANDNIKYTSNVDLLRECNCFIVAVPTPIDIHKSPNFEPLIRACEIVGGVLKKNDIVIFESTVYPGATEEVCVPVLEKFSNLIFNDDFFCGYSPERINPGDKVHKLSDIRKITSGSTPGTAKIVDDLYSEIILAGTYKAESIKIAEAAKVIENTQRDLNIALINELAIIFNRMGLDTDSVLKAAKTKWNFLPFTPGLVGGHCIGVDPYYLTYKAESIGYKPDLILAGRRINDGMGAYIATQLVKLMTKRSIPVQNSNILIMGITFKENCKDIRNTKVVDICKELGEYSCKVDVYDPWVEPTYAFDEYGISLIRDPEPGFYDAIILAVAHDSFRQMESSKIRAFGRDPHIFYDLKSIYPQEESDLRL